MKTFGIVAHVDAGKTTLSEALLYQSGQLRTLGRVDNQDTFLDPDALEQARGITIFSHAAQFNLGDKPATLLDTPGHLDFAAQVEQVLDALDYAILVVAGNAPLSGHTRTLWNLLQRYGVPTFIFVNKMDAIGADAKQTLASLQADLDAGCLPLAHLDDDAKEAIAVLDDDVLQQYLESGELTTATIQQLIAKRQLFPVYFGAALKLDGVSALLDGLATYTKESPVLPKFAARVFKITHDQGVRLSWLRVLGGSLAPKQMLGDEQINQLRVYNGTKYTVAEKIHASEVCAIPNLQQTHAGMGLGALADAPKPILQPVLSYALDPLDEDLHACLQAMEELGDEDPQLQVTWSKTLQEIRLQVMGPIQVEILTALLHDRFGLTVKFVAGGVLYRETVAQVVEGVGHFEPLRHYAEVHLRIAPGKSGSGLVFDSACSPDVLTQNFQHQILTALQAKTQLGVLIGAPLTDVHVTLISGRASVKHSVGGDFRQAAWRALRQGLMMLRKAKDVLLEPWYRFELVVPTESIGRAMTDIQRMQGEFGQPEQTGAFTRLTGSAPVSEMQDYATQLRSYAHGSGQLSLVPDGYRPAHDADAVIKARAYVPTADLENTPDSVFCAHGAGYPVAWDDVPDMAHVPYLATDVLVRSN
ncbi:GTP-binding protein [Lacticaseibacillus sp. N501-2]|uniref:GTP-binding protein n=1 Tax=Lacticaseibacillus salsurae TaxID=3367729 RepID=UPI0038B24136